MGGIDVWNINLSVQIARCGLDEEANIPLSVAFIHNGTAVMSGSTTGSISLWDIATQEKITSLSQAGIIPAKAVFTLSF